MNRTDSLYRHGTDTGHTGRCDAFDLCDGCKTVGEAARILRMEARREIVQRETVSV